MNTIYIRVIILMAALLFVFTFAGCGEQQNRKQVVTEQTAENGTSSSEAVTSEDANGISVEDAKTIALNHAGLSADEVAFVIAKFDNDIFVPHYDIEFTADGYEYDYEINAATGTIIDYDKELDDDKQSKADSSDYITAEKAKEIVLQHVGLSEKDISGYKCELDADDLIPHFEIEFISEKYEYEYEINAKTGNIMFSEKELDD